MLILNVLQSRALGLVFSYAYQSHYYAQLYIVPISWNVSMVVEAIAVQIDALSLQQKMRKYMATIGLRKPLVRKWLPLIYIIALVTIAGVTSAARASGAPTGPELRAAVIVAILRFTSWPSVVAESEATQVRLCAVGEPHSSPYLLPASGVQKVAGHTLVVDEVQADEVATKPCDALVIGSKVNPREFSDLLAKADAQSLLTICDGCRSTYAAGTIIQLDLHKRRVKFEVNLIKARASGVKLDAQLLELASVVRK